MGLGLGLGLCISCCAFDDQRWGSAWCRDLKEIASAVHGTSLAWSHTDESLGLSEFRSILTTLKYDGFIEETRPVAGARHTEGDPTFRVVGKAVPINSLVAVPCGSCPVRALSIALSTQCHCCSSPVNFCSESLNQVSLARCCRCCCEFDGWFDSFMRLDWFTVWNVMLWFVRCTTSALQTA